MSRDITIASDGRARETVIFDDEGQKLENVKSVAISIDAASDVIDVVLEVNHARINVKGKVNEITFVCPCCGEYFTHECSDDGSSMTGTTSHTLTPQMRQVHPGTNLTVAPIVPQTPPASGGMIPASPPPFLFFSSGQISCETNRVVGQGKCDYEIKGIPDGGNPINPGQNLFLKCDLSHGHNMSIHHHDPDKNVNWNYNTSLSPTYRV